MRKCKLWSVLLAVLLLSACVVGILITGTLAEGTDYTWYVDGVGTTADHYATVDAAMAKAKAKTNWAKGDSLTVYVTKSGTATTFSTATVGRHLFSVYTIFRADNTKLPITINGDDPTTAGVEQNSIVFGNEPTWKPNNYKAFSAANDFTLKNLDLSTWGNTNYLFLGGSGEVTFDNVNFGTTQTMIITPSVGGWTAFTSWTPAQFNANADSDGLQPTGFTFKNTDYGKNIGTLSSRPINFGIANIGNDTGGGIKIKNEMLRNKIVIGQGSEVENLTHHNVASFVALAQEPGESVIEVDGGSVTNLLGAAELTGYKGIGKKLVTNVKSGTVTNLHMGPGVSGTSYTGDSEINWTGGTVTSYKSVKAGTVTGTVTNHVKGIDASNYTANGFNMSGAIAGTIHNIYENCTINAGRFLGVSGKVENVINTLKGTLTTNQENFYLGTNTETIKGKIINNIACDVVSSINKTVTIWGGCNGGKVNGTIENNLLAGADIDIFIAGNNGLNIAVGEGSNAAGIENNMTGGHVGTFYAAHGNNNQQVLPSVESNLLGGTIDLFVGASGEGAKTDKGTVTKVTNNIGQPNGNGTYAGSVWIKKFYGGAYLEASVAGEIENNYYAGTIGAENRADGKSWVSDDGTYVGFGGSLLGTVGKITNNFYGGIINVGYFYCGNASSNAAFDTSLTLGEGEYRLRNNVYGGHFARFCGGSKGGDALSIGNFIQGTAHGSITSRDGAFYGGLGASGKTDVYNEISGFAPVNLGTAGDLTADRTKLGTMFYGGNNNQEVAAKSVTNVVKNGAKISYLVGGCNSGVQPLKITNHIYDGVIGEFYGGNKNNGSRSEMTGITTTFDAGEITNYYGGFKTAPVGLKIGSIENNIGGGKIVSFVGGHGTAYDSNDVGEIVSITNNIKGGTFTKEFIAGCKETSAAAETATADAVYKIGSITNNVGSDTVEERPIFSCIYYGGCFAELPAKNGNGASSYFEIGSITNNLKNVLVNNSAYLGTRYHTLCNITNIIDGLEIKGAVLSLGNNVGAFTGASNTTFHSIILNAALAADANSSSCAIPQSATFAVHFAEGAKIYLAKGKTMNLKGNNPSKGTHTVTAENFELIQQDLWADGTVYLSAPEGTKLLGLVTVSGGALGTAEVFDDKVVGRSTLSFEEANFILSERVALRIVYDKPVATEYDPELLCVLANGAAGKIEIDPENEYAVIVSGIGLVNFDKEITFGGYLPALPSDRDTVIELSDYAVGKTENNEIYKAIADLGRVFKGETAQYGLSYTEVEKISQMNAEMDTSALEVTGKNLIMKDAIGFRYYATLADDTTVDDIKVFVDGDDYTEFCNIALVEGSATEVTIDLYLGIRSMDTFLNVKITAGQTTALDYMDCGDAIAQKIISSQEDNAAAKAALVYIQTVAKLQTGGAK